MRFALFAAAFLAAVPASAITYVGNRTVGTSNVSLSITTDGTLGVLSQANIVNWTVSVNDGVNAGTFTPGAGNRFTMLGSGFTASATQFSFDFGATGSFMVFGNTENGPPGKYYCIDAGLSCLGAGFGAGGEYADPFANSTDFYSRAGRGVEVLATVATTGVPEPASWAMLIAGFGLTGASARRRRTVQA
jgi:hypothetical protein